MTSAFNRPWCLPDADPGHVRQHICVTAIVNVALFPLCLTLVCRTARLRRRTAWSAPPTSRRLCCRLRHRRADNNDATTPLPPKPPLKHHLPRPTSPGLCMLIVIFVVVSSPSPSQSLSSLLSAATAAFVIPTTADDFSWPDR